MTAHHLKTVRRRVAGRASMPETPYLYILGKTQRRQRMKLLRYPVLPYPKKEAAANG